mmetsp:Transcript_65889/g.104374  ORF Transcript_65889/g.104374 Transcript_65889/m.104374 type:complete len:107 (-) Transcript_65889:461-781(-)
MTIYGISDNRRDEVLPHLRLRPACYNQESDKRKDLNKTPQLVQDFERASILSLSSATIDGDDVPAQFPCILGTASAKIPFLNKIQHAVLRTAHNTNRAGRRIERPN